ncbi:MAG: Ig-like domain-containing protein, partial [Bacilli bacterium]|nr:Ig-like domain-containing protein [Bacilli bacterium]
MKRTTKFLAPLTLMATLALTGCSFLYIPVDSSSEKPSSETSTSSSASEDTSEESTSQTSYVEEPGKVTNIVVSFVKDTINVGSTIQATATIAPADAINKNVTWSSSNKAVATVDREGLVTGVSEGQTTITAIAADGSGVFGEATLNVTLATGGTTK